MASETVLGALALALVDVGLLGRQPEHLSQHRLLGVDQLLHFGHFVTQEVELGQLVLEVVLHAKLRYIGLVELGDLGADPEAADHGRGAVDIVYPDGGYLLEADGDSRPADGLSVDGVDVQVHQLLTGLVIPQHAGEVPLGVDDVAVVEGQGAVAVTRQFLAVDGDVGVAARLFRLADIEAEVLD